MELKSKLKKKYSLKIKIILDTHKMVEIYLNN